jgi:hypothetical protein
MFVKPQHEVVRDAHDFYRPLPPEGKEVPDSRYWRRLLRVGDVVLGTPPQPAKTEKHKEKNAEADAQA